MKGAPMFANALKLLDVSGFEIRIHPSWLIIAALIVWSLSTAYFPQQIEGLGPSDSLILSTIAMLLLFAGLVLHELAHALTARHFGLNVGGITLFIFGGVAELEQEPESPRSEFWIAIAGPAMSLALAALAWLLARAASGDLIRALMEYLALINLVLVAFNLLPAFPLDGGRVLRAALWRWSGDLLHATRIASQAGAGIGYALIIVGLFGLFAGGTGIGGLWQILIGVFLVAAARGTYTQMRFAQGLRGRTVADLMSRHVISASPEATVQEVVESLMLAHAVSFLPVVEDGRVIGYIDTGIVHGIDRENWDTTHVDDVFAGLDDTVRIAPDLPLSELFERIGKTGRRKFVVLTNGQLEGIISLSDLTGYLAVLTELGDTPIPRRRA